jgi:hypothetical protein
VRHTKLHNPQKFHQQQSQEVTTKKKRMADICKKNKNNLPNFLLPSEETNPLD